MPWLFTPRIVATPISPTASRAPTFASGASIPARTFGAPHTIESVSPPASTLHTLSLSALGCRATSSTRAATTPSNGGTSGSHDSTSRPDMVSRCASSSVVSDGSTRRRSQLSGTFMTGQANCLRNLRSPSKNSRRSSMP